MDARRVKTRRSRGFSEADSPAPQGHAPLNAILPAWSIFGLNRHQMPLPTAIACKEEGNDVSKLTLARGASTRRIASFALPVIDVYAGTFEEVQCVPAIRAYIFLDQTAQDILALLLERRKVLTLGRQQFGVLHRGSPRRAAESSFSRPPTRHETPPKLFLSG